MDLTAGVLTRVLAVCRGAEPSEPAETVLVLRQEQPSFAPTLFAAWRAEGSPLNPALGFEVDAALTRTRTYRRLAAEIAAAHPGVLPVKGLEVADLYPPGLPRHLNDLDYVATDERALWRLVRGLVDQDWDLHVATFCLLEDRLHVVVCLRRPHEDPFQLPYGVEVSSYATLGDLAGVPPVVRPPDTWRDPVPKNLAMLLFERFEQPFRARDVLDAALLLAAAGPDGGAVAHAEVERFGLWPEYGELVALLDAAGLPRPPGPAGRPLARRVAGRARRARRTLTALRRRPADGALRHLQRRLVFDRQSAAERRLWAAAQSRLSTGRALRAGLLCFGLPIGEVPGDRREVAAVRRRGELVYVDTPVGRFLLTAGDEIPEDAVDALTPPGDAAGGSGRPGGSGGGSGGSGGFGGRSDGGGVAAASEPAR